MATSIATRAHLPPNFKVVLVEPNGNILTIYTSVMGYSREYRVAIVTLSLKEQTPSRGEVHMFTGFVFWFIYLLRVSLGDISLGSNSILMSLFGMCKV
jgi:hypothetical protein